MKMHQTQTNKGFSVVEFIVVLTIFAIMASVAIFNYADYRRSIEQTNVAQDIALSIRQAQLYGISAGDGVIGNSDYLDSGFNVSGTALVDITQDRSIRGVSFDLNNDPVVMTIYEDIDRDGRYIDGSDRVIDKRSIISNDISLASFCLDELLGLCGSTKTNGILDITFERPYTDATVLYRTNSSSTPSSYNTVGLVIEADGSGKDIQVDVSSIGKISVH